MAHNTSLFAQLVKIIPGGVFERAVRETRAEHGAKGFSCYTQFVGMLFCQFANADSLREVCDGLRAACGKLNHLGIQKAPTKSTLSYANKHRPWQLYFNLFGYMVQQCESVAPGKKGRFRFKNPLYSLDSTTVDLCLSLFPWAKFRQTKGAIKLHVKLSHDGYMPAFAVVTDGSVADITIARTLSFPEGSIVAMDRGYFDYGLFGAWTRQGIFFVTRMKDNAAYRVVKSLPLPQRRNILSDEIIELTSVTGRKICPFRLRRVVAWDESTQREFVFLTNHLEFGSTTIAAIYKDRWAIESFFKSLKQDLTIKSFIGTSENALKTQIWTALISLLLLRYLQFRSRCGWSFCRLVGLLRLNLFSYRDLWRWLDNPFEEPPERPTFQLALNI